MMPVMMMRAMGWVSDDACDDDEGDGMGECEILLLVAIV